MQFRQLRHENEQKVHFRGLVAYLLPWSSSSKRIAGFGSEPAAPYPEPVGARKVHFHLRAIQRLFVSRVSLGLANLEVAILSVVASLWEYA